VSVFLSAVRLTAASALRWNLGIDYQSLGEFDKSLEYFDKGIRASPYDPAVAYWYGGKATANFAMKRYDQATELARRATAIKPNYNQFSHVLLVAALALRTWRRRRSRDQGFRSRWSGASGGPRVRRSASSTMSF
jgi:tetratricopeptide (TPR) repeat protein